MPSNALLNDCASNLLLQHEIEGICFNPTERDYRGPIHPMSLDIISSMPVG